MPRAAAAPRAKSRTHPPRRSARRAPSGALSSQPYRPDASSLRRTARSGPCPPWRHRTAPFARLPVCPFARLPVCPREPNPRRHFPVLHRQYNRRAMPARTDNTKRARFASRLAALPTRPGVYIMRNAKGDVIYVGKAASPAQPRAQLLRRAALAGAQDPRPRRADRGLRVHRHAERRRGAAPGSDAGQAPPALLQRPPQGRQALPLPAHRRPERLAARRDRPPRRATTARATSGPTPRRRRCAPR